VDTYGGYSRHGGGAFSGKTPILVGGTYFYLSQLLYSKGEHVETIDWYKRNDLEKKSIEELQCMLKNKDPELFVSMNNSDRNNPRRLIRRLEILESDSIEAFHQNKHDNTILLYEKLKDRDIRIHIEGFYRDDREAMKKAIQQRVEKRISNGAITEAEKVFKRFSLSSPGLKSIGYSQIRDYLEKKIDSKQLIESWTNKEYQYAKRQYVFMKHDINISWINIP
jgi:tRNA dimethylallyltransferase